MAIPDRLAAALADRYRLERELGQGGMATVYLAEDLKHNRKVAVKVLKPELAAVLGAERFVVEIKTTAALQHPHILPLFDSGTADGYLFYVMPFIQGETLRDKLNRETQLGVDEAVRITREIADALHYAHTQGVIHRDIKPENILLANGRPMVADFGIALAVSAAAGGRMTETGLSLGTPHYMSPEQATAEKEITGRSDIYSLASVCYEMLTGNPPHVGSSAQQIIMKIITEQAQPVTTFRKTVPPHVAAAVAQGLEKLPADRFESAEKFAAALGNPAFTIASTAYAPATAKASRGALLGVSAVAVLATAIAAWFALKPVPAAPVLRYRLALPDSQAPRPQFPAPALAPDGSFLIYHGPVSGTSTAHQLWIKRREDRDATPITGTRDAGFIAISPDGKQLIFDYGGRLRLLPITGGSAREFVIPQVVQAFGLTWLDDKRVAFTSSSATNGNLLSLWTLDVTTEVVTELTAVTTDGRGSGVPQAIPGRDALLYLSCITPSECNLRVYDARTNETKPLVSGSVFGVVSLSGHLLYARGGILLATRFDVDDLSIIGESITLDEDFTLPSALINPLTLSPEGTMAMSLGGAGIGSIAQELVWVDRNGRIELVDAAMSDIRHTATGVNHGWSLSPDGSRLAIGLSTESGDDIWVKQLPNGALTRVTFNAEPDYRPTWTPDGRSILFITPTGLRLRRADGTGQDSSFSAWPANEAQYSNDGQWLIARGGAGGSVVGGRDIFAMRVGQDSLPRPILSSNTYDETAPELSPDSHWLLYQSNESGRNEIYLRPFPNVDGQRFQVSVGGGETPLWSRNGKEIFFVSSDRQMMTAAFTAAPSPKIATPRALFPLPSSLLGVETAFNTPWDVAADGRFLMSRSKAQRTEVRSEIIITHNFFTELNRLLPR